MKMSADGLSMVCRGSVDGLSMVCRWSVDGLSGVAGMDYKVIILSRYLSIVCRGSRAWITR